MKPHSCLDQLTDNWTKRPNVTTPTGDTTTTVRALTPKTNHTYQAMVTDATAPGGKRTEIINNLDGKPVLVKKRDGDTSNPNKEVQAPTGF